MAKESFDKEIQMLRLLFLTNGAHTRQQLAQRLGISVHTLDKTMRKLKEIVSTLYPDTTEARGADSSASLDFRFADEHTLMFFYHAKSVKDSEITRLLTVLSNLNRTAMSVKELLDAFEQEGEWDGELPDEKTLRQDVKYLEEIGVIVRTTDTRPYRYRLDDSLFTALSPNELLALFDFVGIMANTELPAVHGYFLRDRLKKYLTREHDCTDFHVFSYKYAYMSRILDEYQALALLEAIKHRKSVRFRYHTPKLRQWYESQQTNPLFAKEMNGKQAHVIPLKVVYDHQYGRWYLLAQSFPPRPDRQSLRTFRMEGISLLEEAEALDDNLLQPFREAAAEWLKTSWLVDTGKPVLVKLRFFNPEQSPHNFIRERVESQGQWGQIVDEDEASFLYEIRVNSISEMKPWIRSFGSSCEVLAPQWLRDELMQEWEEILRYYEPV